MFNFNHFGASWDFSKRFDETHWSVPYQIKLFKQKFNQIPCKKRVTIGDGLIYNFSTPNPIHTNAYTYKCAYIKITNFNEILIVFFDFF